MLPESDYIYDFSFPKEDGKPNPHLWTDPTYAIKYAAVIRDELSKLDPANASYYAANYDAFAKKATELADALRADQKTVPEGNLKLLTYHDAYAYFAKNFGWQVIGALQPKSFSDPTPAEVARAHRPGEGARRSRRSSAPRCSRRPCSRRSAERRVRATRTPCATTTCPARRASRTTPGSAS